MQKVTAQLARILVESCDGVSESTMKKNVKEFVTFLGEHNLLGSWRDIEHHIHKIWKDRYGASQITIVSAHELTEPARVALTKLANGAEVIERVDERLIAGSVVRMDDIRIDGSISGTLRRLNRTLSNA